MTVIQELILESDQLRLENDSDGPQDELEFWKCRAAKLSLLVGQISSSHCRILLATLRAAQSRLIRVRELSMFARARRSPLLFRSGEAASTRSSNITWRRRITPSSSEQWRNTAIPFILR